MVSTRLSDDVPDAGWSWVIAASCCFINMMTYGMERLSGVLFVATLKTFPVSRQEASFPYSLSATIKNVSGPLVGLLGQKFGVRLVTIAGGLVGAAGIAVCYTAWEVMWITIFWGVVFGLGFGLGNVLLPVAINQYFDRHRATASGISLSGACVGSFFLPLLVDELLDVYGLNGTFLIAAGLVLNCVPFAMLLRKPPYTIIGHGPKERTSIVIRKQPNALETDHLRRTDPKAPECPEIRNGDCLELTTETEKSKQNIITSSSIDDESSDCRKCSHIHGTEGDPNKITENVQHGDIIEIKVTYESNMSHCIEVDKNELNLQYSSEYANSYIVPNVSKDIDMPNAHTNHISGRNGNLPFLEVAPCQQMELEGNGQKSEDQMTKKHKSTLKKSLTLLINPMFLLITVSVALYGFSFLCMITAVVDYAADIEIPDNKSKYAIVCFSVGDLIGRLGLGWITDRGYMTKAGFCASCFVLQGVAAAAVAWTSDFASLMVTMWVYGIFEAGLIVIFPLLVAQYIDDDLQTVAIPSSNVLHGPIALCVPPAIGFFRENKGSYTGVFYLVGLISLACALAWLLALYLEKCRTRVKRARS